MNFTLLPGYNLWPTKPWKFFSKDTTSCIFTAMKGTCQRKLFEKLSSNGCSIRYPENTELIYCRTKDLE